MNWKKLEWVDSRYEVSDEGHVRSWANSHGGLAKNPHTLKPQKIISGYAEVRLMCHGKAKHFLVHRLVVQAFLGITPLQVNHKNGDKLDNRLCNLEESSASHNALHAYRSLRRTSPRGMLGRTGARNPRSKRVAQLSLSGEVVKIWDAVAEASRHGFSCSNIWSVCVGNRKTHKGFKWRYI